MAEMKKVISLVDEHKRAIQLAWMKDSEANVKKCEEALEGAIAKLEAKLLAHANAIGLKAVDRTDNLVSRSVASNDYGARFTVPSNHPLIRQQHQALLEAKRKRDRGAANIIKTIASLRRDLTLASELTPALERRVRDLLAIADTDD